MYIGDAGAGGDFGGGDAGGGGGDLHRVEINLEFMRNDLCNLCIQPLPHFGAAMIQHM